MYLPVTNLIKGKTPKMHNNREESSADRRLVPHHQSRSKQRRPSNPEITAESSRGRREDISRRSDPTPSRHSGAQRDEQFDDVDFMEGQPSDLDVGGVRRPSPIVSACAAPRHTRTGERRTSRPSRTSRQLSVLDDEIRRVENRIRDLQSSIRASQSASDSHRTDNSE